MTLMSMTGFARVDGADGDARWTWELKSVNGRGLDLRFRTPNGLDALEPRARKLASERLKRGSVALSLQVNESARVEGYRVNRPLLDQLAGIVREVEQKIDAGAPSIDGLLALRGVIEVVEPEESPEARARREDLLLASLAEALAGLERTRAEEGRRLTEVIGGLVDEIERLLAEAQRAAALRPEALMARLREQLAELLGQTPPVAEDRLAQELALLVARGDIREEIDRLHGHIQAARAILQSGGDGGGAGRQLDFLTQEFNREANTLCSKSGDRELTRIGLALKLAVDRMREQVQNVE